MPKRHPLLPTALVAFTLAAGTVVTVVPEARAASISASSQTDDAVQYVQDSLYAAGNAGYVHRRANADGSAGPYTWRGYDGGERTLDGYSGALPGQHGYYGNGGDTVLVSQQYAGG
ncbi:hypothetical protein [Streptomyces sp. NRRL S-646]|uniref:hypothetical protein n=1 Tax=Streptomyces sp. NRRL S-646 TaxID=1463917 RepID=UPI0004C9B8A9|nr:hypothetical protein [Streptomyces sp. NRRL S-646]